MYNYYITAALEFYILFVVSSPSVKFRFSSLNFLISYYWQHTSLLLEITYENLFVFILKIIKIRILMNNIPEMQIHQTSEYSDVA